MLIPLDVPPFHDGISGGFTVDAAGNRFVYGGKAADEILMFDRQSGRTTLESVGLASTAGRQLSRNGQRFYFKGSTFPPDQNFRGIAYIEWESGETIYAIEGSVLPLFSVDASGGLVALESNTALDIQEMPRFDSAEYFVYSVSDGTAQRMSRVSGSVPFRSRCVGAVVPMIDAVGATVIIVSDVALLPAIPTDDACRIYRYLVEDSSLEYIADIPGTQLVTTSIDDDASRLYAMLKFGRATVNASLDLESGLWSNFLPEHSVFDPTVTGNGQRVVVSSFEDLDPMIGNPDGNFEMFAYDIDSQAFTQLTDTEGGVGPRSGTCSTYNPAVDSSGQTVVFGFKLFTVGGCDISSPQRDRRSGMAFRRAAAVQQREGNQSVRLERHKGDNIVVTPGIRVQIELDAVDPDGDAVTIFGELADQVDLPRSSEFSIATELGHASATFRWEPTDLDIGEYVLRFAAFDWGGGIDLVTTRVVVCSRIVDRAETRDVVQAIFDPTTPLECGGSDVNLDGVVSAADLVWRDTGIDGTLRWTPFFGPIMGVASSRLRTGVSGERR